MKHGIFAWSAVALIASSALVGCVVEEDKNVDNTDGGVAGKGSGGNGATGGTAGTGGSSTAGTGGATGGTGATGGSAGATGGTGGTTGGAGGTTGGTGGTGGAACLDDTATTTPDCANLPYASTQCDDNGSTVAAYGNIVCAYTKLYGRPGVFESVYNCLNAIGGDACSVSHDAAADSCYATAFGNACTLELPQATCADYEAACPGLQSTCDALISGYTLDAQEKIAQCFNAGTGECTKDFNDCLAEPVSGN
ncbi:MAG: hypothetical protein AB7K71_24245 [Polyangiaceae bacterium]